LTGQDYKIPILACGTIQLQILRSTNIADLITVVPIKIYSEGGETKVDAELPISKSTFYNVTTYFDPKTNTLTVYPSNNWNNGDALGTQKKPWLIIGIFTILAILMIVLLVLLSISMYERESLRHTERELLAKK